MVEFACTRAPFWGRLPWLQKRRGGKHSKHRKVIKLPGLRPCAHGVLAGWIFTTFDGG